MIRLIKFLMNVLIQPRNLFHKGYKVKFFRPYFINYPECVDVGNNSIIHKNVILNPIVRYKNQRFSPRIKIGENCYIGLYAQIHALGYLAIGNNCVFSDNLYMNDALHSIENLDRSILENEVYSKGNISIGDNCFIGYDVAILSGVSIGDHCVIASKSLVISSFPSYSMIAGNPAKIIKTYDGIKKCWVKINDI